MYSGARSTSVLVVVVVLFSIYVNLAESYGSSLHLAPRIVGGSPIFDRCRAPYNSMVALQFPAPFSPITFCSAVMVTESFLVTTAKCLFVMAENDKLAVAVIGERDTVMMREPGEQRIAIKSFKIHFLYNETDRANDVGLIELARPAKLGRCVKPAIRIEDDPNACTDVDDSCVMTGWGSYSENHNATNSRLPRAAPVSVFNDLITTLLSPLYSDLPPVGTLYAETRNAFQKACFFDWGGLVSCRRNGYNVLRGIIIDHNCNAQRSSPIWVLDIPHYQTWIDRCTADWRNCPKIRTTRLR